MRSRIAVLAVSFALLSIGCSGAPTPSPSPEETPVVVPTRSASEPESVPDPQLPDGPAETTSASLDETDLFSPDGWDQAILEGSFDEGFIGNGTWVHEVDPVLRGGGVLAVGCSEAPQDLTGRVPVGALEGSLERDGAIGVSLALQFADAGIAADYFASWLDELAACTGSLVEPLDQSETHWLGYRDLGEAWSEVGALDGEITRFLILQADLSNEELRGIYDAAEF